MSSPCDPTGVLRKEHALILRVIDGLERFIDQPDDPDPARAGDFVDFFALYTDALHHGKEEDHLFGALVAEGFPRHQGPIAAMLQEHELGRALVREMRSALDRLPADSGSWSGFLHAARSYIDLLRRHIGKEDGALFNMADEAIDEPGCQALCEAYDQVCARRFDGRTMEQLERLGEGLADTAD
jgi:hemerythrin-like domain-containing protein